MCSNKPSGFSFKGLCIDFPNIALLTTSVTPGEVQVAYAHVSIGNKIFRKTVTAFSFAGLLETLTMV